MKIKPSITNIILLMMVILPGLFAAHGYASSFKKHPVTVPLRFDYYYSYDMVVVALKKLDQAYPHLVKLDLVGKSEEGRAIYCMTVNNPKTGKELDKPGVYVDGNIHGNEIQGTEVALYLLNYLLTKYGENDEITRLVDRNCFYVVPTVNVDGRYHFLEGDRPGNNRSLRIPRDNDHDGLIDEDFPDDLDGDGNICQMRRRDPDGQFKTDPEDPRLMVRVKPGEKGEWTMLSREGIDNDEDGRINEDSEGYVDGNRNWGYNWMPDYVQHGAGDYPFSGVGLKALAQFIRQRPNICIAWAFHNTGGMFLRGPSTKDQGEYHPQDVKVYNYLGHQAERITPGYRYIISWKDLYPTHGNFTEWMFMCNGCYAFIGELFMREKEQFRTPEESKRRQDEKKVPVELMEEEEIFAVSRERQREWLKFNDHLTQGELFKPWKPFKHPTYGDIEIGGWVKLSSRIPAPFMLKDMVHRNAAAVIFSAKHTPEVTMKVFAIRKTGKNMYQIRIRLKNANAVPTMSYHAREVKLYPQDMLTVSGKKAKVLLSGPINIYTNDVLTYKKYRPEVQFFAVPGCGKVEYQYLISGSGPVTITYQSRHAGKIVKTIRLH